ncbi:hypothetical protein ED733_006830 [Metarhizium rileyi]|uniref:BCD1 alpha/beta domain-containing protein n=1 Tax=Metarhizium rileyi (strain RCEF 4871) TaxID=1649241 RepID=A0A5C6GP63_METRR|nr:hypothetical protein ED733_006830 [Metarhizium rileyi]
MQTCSLSCIRKHKAWSECSGQRDPTTYVPRSKLRTAAGVDHDYNFLHNIEVSVERSEKLLIEEKGLVQPEELRPLTMQQVRWKTGRDGRKRRVLVTRALREAKSRTFEKGLAQRLKKLNVQIVCVPQGMARQRENSTTLNRRTGRVNWQVEWMVFGGGDAGGHGDGKKGFSRLLSKVMDDIPLFQAYPAMLEAKARAEPGSRKQERNLQPGEMQSSADSRWHLGSDCIQDPVDEKWTSFAGGRVDDWPADKERAQRQQFQFLLAGPPTRLDMPTRVTALESGECLRDVLVNTRVLEFPTIYVLKHGEALPPRLVLGPKDSVSPQDQGTKRKDGPVNKKLQGSAKRRKQGGIDREEGELSSGEDGGHGTAEETGTKGFGLEAGEVIAEQSLGEDDEDEEEEEEDTSSSGSDSESD